MRIVKLTQKERENILENLLKRSPNQYSKFETTVRDILDKVKAEGDQALFAYTEQFDGVKITEETFRVTEEEIAEAYEKVDSHLIEIIRKALVNIRDYHQKQVRYSWFDSKPDGTLLGNGTGTCWCICSGWQSSISVIGSDEYCSGKGGRSRTYRYDNTAGKRWQSISDHIGCSQRGWRR